MTTILNKNYFGNYSCQLSKETPTAVEPSKRTVLREEWFESGAIEAVDRWPTVLIAV